VVVPRKKPASRYHHGDLRAALLAAAWTAVSRKGVEAVSLRSLAETLGVSHAAPAHHFRDREALLDGLRTEAWRRFAEALAGGSPGGLLGTGEAYLAFARAHPRQLQLMFRHPGREPTPELRAEASRAWELLVDGVRAELGPARAADEGEVQALAIAAWAMVQGLATLWAEMSLPGMLPSGPAAAAVQARALETLRAGLAHLGPPASVAFGPGVG
jgi:AcrR family transcriptional regulator